MTLQQVWGRRFLVWGRGDFALVHYMLKAKQDFFSAENEFKKYYRVVKLFFVAKRDIMEGKGTHAQNMCTGDTCF